MEEEDIRKAAYGKWEAEGRPDGQHERHWREAQQEASEKATGVPQTWSSDQAGGVVPAAKNPTSSDAIPSDSPGSFKPDELASETK